ncbi:MAG: phosphoribosyltransferase family protein [Verrucomicrobiales bacterium]
MPDVSGRRILLVDDVLDTGRTLHAIRHRLASECLPLSISLAVLLSNRIDRPVPIEAQYVGFEIDGEFVEVYGLDYAGDYRNLLLLAR